MRAFRRVTVIAILVAAVLAVLGGPASAGRVAPAARADKALGRALARLVTLPGAPLGAIALVQRGRHITVRTAGLARIGGPRPSVGDHMRLASTSKAFSGAVALALVSRGVLGLNDTIAQRLPSLPPAWGAVTLREALQHRSGLPNFTASPAYLQALQASPGHGPAPRALLNFIANEPLSFPPGSKYEYSNTDNIVVGLMVEAVTGRNYETELHRLVLTPLKLTQTTLPTTVALPQPFLHGYQLAEGMGPQDISSLIDPAWTWAAGGLVSTPADLNRFARGYVAGRLFSPAVRHQQLQTVTGASEPPGPGLNSAGLGIFRYRTRCGTVYGHTGNFPGYTQFFAATLDGRRSVVVSVNEQLRPDVDRRVFDSLRDVETIAICSALAGSR